MRLICPHCERDLIHTEQTLIEPEFVDGVWCDVCEEWICCGCEDWHVDDDRMTTDMTTGVTIMMTTEKTQFIYRNVSLTATSGCRLMAYGRWSPKLMKTLQVRLVKGDDVLAVVIVSCGEMSRKHFFSWAKAQGFDKSQIDYLDGEQS